MRLQVLSGRTCSRSGATAGPSTPRDPWWPPWGSRQLPSCRIAGRLQACRHPTGTPRVAQVPPRRAQRPANPLRSSRASEAPLLRWYQSDPPAGAGPTLTSSWSPLRQWGNPRGALPALLLLAQGRRTQSPELVAGMGLRMETLLQDQMQQPLQKQPGNLGAGPGRQLSRVHLMLQTPFQQKPGAPLVARAAMPQLLLLSLPDLKRTYLMTAELPAGGGSAAQQMPMWELAGKGSVLMMQMQSPPPKTPLWLRRLQPSQARHGRNNPMTEPLQEAKVLSPGTR